MKYKRGITGIKIAVFIAIASLLFIPCSSYAEVTFSSLAPIEHGLKLPEDVAVAPDGKVYAVDGSQGLIMTYSSSGAPAGNIWISKPTSVAVDANGLIYVGTNENLSVKILDSSYNVIGSLGSGAGEFKLPRNIAIDKATGNVYVVDQIDQSIKIYASNGTFVKKINDYPNLPQDVTIMNNKIYVIDHPLITDQWGGRIRGAKVRVFDMAGNVLGDETFGSYGDQEGQFVRPAGITSDTDGVLYISDSFHGVVMCFQADGTYLGAIQNPSKPMVTPMGIALGVDRRLLVASLNTGSIHAFGLEGYTAPEGIDVTPSSLAFAAERGQANPPEQKLTISNNGSEGITYTASANQEWIVLETISIIVANGSTGMIPVGVDATELETGAYDGQVTITNGTGAMVNIPITLEVTMPVAQAALSVSPETLEFTYKVGDTNPSSQTITVELDGTTTWTAEEDIEWLDIAPSTGQGDISFVTVSVDPAGLETGDHTGTITVSAPDADGSPATVTVTLTVLFGGAIQVTCNIEEASFSIEGPEGAIYEGSGETWSESEVPGGTYTINYNQVTGYGTPFSETKELSGAETITFEGIYESLAMSANIVASRGADFWNDAAIGIFDKEGTLRYSFSPFTDNNNAGGSAWYFWNSLRAKDGACANTAIGDIDGDGSQDIVVGRGYSSSNAAEVEVHRANGTLIEGSKFQALSTRFGAKVAAGDFDGDRKAEIVVGAGAYFTNSAQVKVFSYNAGAIVDTGIDFVAFELKGGVNVAAGDVDGDGLAELITAAGVGPRAKPEIRILKVDTSGGLGQWSVIDTGIRFTAFSGRYGAFVTTGDLNGDGTDEVIVSSGPDPRGGLNIIKAFNGDGTEFGLEIFDSSIGYGLSVASGDLDSDAVAEIVVGLGSAFMNPSMVKIYRTDGSFAGMFEAFSGVRYGTLVSVGDLGY
jgi:hypothetical protein